MTPMFDADRLQRVADKSAEFEELHGQLSTLGVEIERERTVTRVLLKVCLWLIVIFGALTIYGQIANASPHEALVRVWVSEAGWNSPADHAGVSAVLYRRAHRYGRSHRHPIVLAAERYSRRTQPSWDGPRSERLTWVSSLTEQCEPTAGSAWSLYRRQCVEAHDRAAAWLAGDSWECRASGPMDHWGGPMDEPGNLVPILVRCREPHGRWTASKNTFYCEPSSRACPNSCEPMEQWQTFTSPWETARS